VILFAMKPVRGLWKDYLRPLFSGHADYLAQALDESARSILRQGPSAGRGASLPAKSAASRFIGKPA